MDSKVADEKFVLHKHNHNNHKRGEMHESGQKTRPQVPSKAKLTASIAGEPSANHHNQQINSIQQNGVELSLECCASLSKMTVDSGDHSYPVEADSICARTGSNLQNPTRVEVEVEPKNQGDKTNNGNSNELVVETSDSNALLHTTTPSVNRSDSSNHLSNHLLDDDVDERKSSISFDKIKQISLTYSIQSNMDEEDKNSDHDDYGNDAIETNSQHNKQSDSSTNSNNYNKSLASTEDAEMASFQNLRSPDQVIDLRVAGDDDDSYTTRRRISQNPFLPKNSDDPSYAVPRSLKQIRDQQAQLEAKLAQMSTNNDQPFYQLAFQQDDDEDYAYDYERGNETNDDEDDELDINEQDEDLDEEDFGEQFFEAELDESGAYQFSPGYELDGGRAPDFRTERTGARLTRDDFKDDSSPTTGRNQNDPGSWPTFQVRGPRARSPAINTNQALRGRHINNRTTSSQAHNHTHNHNYDHNNHRSAPPSRERSSESLASNQRVVVTQRVSQNYLSSLPYADDNNESINTHQRRGWPAAVARKRKLRAGATACYLSSTSDGTRTNTPVDDGGYSLLDHQQHQAGLWLMYENSKANQANKMTMTKTYIKNKLAPAMNRRQLKGPSLGADDHKIAMKNDIGLQMKQQKQLQEGIMTTLESTVNNETTSKLQANYSHQQANHNNQFKQSKEKDNHDNYDHHHDPYCQLSFEPRNNNNKVAYTTIGDHELPPPKPPMRRVESGAIGWASGIRDTNLASAPLPDPGHSFVRSTALLIGNDINGRQTSVGTESQSLVAAAAAASQRAGHIEAREERAAGLESPAPNELGLQSERENFGPPTITSLMVDNNDRASQDHRLSLNDEQDEDGNRVRDQVRNASEVLVAKSSRGPADWSSFAAPEMTPLPGGGHNIESTNTIISGQNVKDGQQSGLCDEQTRQDGDLTNYNKRGGRARFNFSPPATTKIGNPGAKRAPMAAQFVRWSDYFNSELCGPAIAPQSAVGANQPWRPRAQSISRLMSSSPNHNTQTYTQNHNHIINNNHDHNNNSNTNSNLTQGLASPSAGPLYGPAHTSDREESLSWQDPQYPPSSHWPSKRRQQHLSQLRPISPSKSKQRQQQFFIRDKRQQQQYDHFYYQRERERERELQLQARGINIYGTPVRSRTGGGGPKSPRAMGEGYAPLIAALDCEQHLDQQPWTPLIRPHLAPRSSTAATCHCCYASNQLACPARDPRPGPWSCSAAAYGAGRPSEIERLLGGECVNCYTTLSQQQQQQQNRQHVTMDSNFAPPSIEQQLAMMPVQWQRPTARLSRVEAPVPSARSSGLTRGFVLNRGLPTGVESSTVYRAAVPTKGSRANYYDYALSASDEATYCQGERKGLMMIQKQQHQQQQQQETPTPSFSSLPHHQQMERKGFNQGLDLAPSSRSIDLQAAVASSREMMTANELYNNNNNGNSLTISTHSRASAIATGTGKPKGQLLSLFNEQEPRACPVGVVNQCTNGINNNNNNNIASIDIPTITLNSDTTPLPPPADSPTNPGYLRDSDQAKQITTMENNITRANVVTMTSSSNAISMRVLNPALDDKNEQQVEPQRAGDAPTTDSKLDQSLATSPSQQNNEKLVHVEQLPPPATPRPSSSTSQNATLSRASR